MARPPDSVLFPKAATSGIVATPAGERVVQTSRRPDGTLRKEIKIRPGFTPEEDVHKFRSTRTAQELARQDYKLRGIVPGAQVAAAIAGAQSRTAAQRKNEKRREKKAEEKSKVKEEAPDDWDADEPDTSSSFPSAAAAETAAKAASETSAPTPDDEEARKKRLRALQKSLRQAKTLQEKPAAELNPDQQAKVDGIAELEKQIAGLEI